MAWLACDATDQWWHTQQRSPAHVDRHAVVIARSEVYNARKIFIVISSLGTRVEL
jgi:hypothetical protein